jgi:hypothetical protein
MAEERPGVVERAFQLAKGGTVATMSELNSRLTAEGYVDSARSLAGRSIANQLSRMMGEARLAGTSVIPKGSAP